MGILQYLKGCFEKRLLLANHGHMKLEAYSENLIQPRLNVKIKKIYSESWNHSWKKLNDMEEKHGGCNI